MSETIPQTTTPEVVTNNPEGLPPRDEAIDAVRNEINALQTELSEAEAKVRAPGGTASAEEIIDARAKLRELRENNEPRLNGLREMWTSYGGEDIDRAQEAADGLNFKSDATDHITARGLGKAKDAFYAKLQESMHDQEPTPAPTPEAVATSHDIEQIGDYVRNNPDAPETAAIREQVDKMMEEIQATLARNSSETNSDDPQPAPTDPSDLNDAPPAPTGDNDDTVVLDRDAILAAANDSRMPNDDTARAEATQSHIDNYLYEIAEAENRGHDAEIEKYERAEAERQFNHDNKLHRRVYRRLNVLYTTGVESFKRSDRKTKIAVYAGAAALVVAAIWAGVSPDDHADKAPQPTGGGNPDGLGEFVNPDATTGAEANAPELPASDSSQYPFGWAEQVFGQDNAMSGLRDLGEKAAADGHNVEWHGSGTRQWVEIDGNSSTKNVIDILRQYHNK